MKKWKILLLGVTGDLSKKKILPAISQFAELNQDKVQIELIGYSRSQPNKEQTLQILKKSSERGFTAIKNITFETGEYNSDYFDSLYSSLVKDETLVVYMAVPPTVFINFLETSCPYHHKNVHIIVEKPFGSDIQQARQMLDLVVHCKLPRKVHYCDHYLFKSELKLDDQSLTQIRQIASHSELQEVYIQALESVGVEGRKGYYDQVGALKDMLPHLFSLSLVAEKILGLSSLKDSQNITINKVELGQYKDYLVNLKLKKSDIETYFFSSFQTDKGFKINWETGKKLSRKLTQIKFVFKNKQTFVWTIYPNKKTNTKLDHVNLFEDILENKFDRFVNEDEIVASWRLFEKISNFIDINKLDLKIY